MFDEHVAIISWVVCVNDVCSQCNWNGLYIERPWHNIHKVVLIVSAQVRIHLKKDGWVKDNKFVQNSL